MKRKLANILLSLFMFLILFSFIDVGFRLYNKRYDLITFEQNKPPVLSPSGKIQHYKYKTWLNSAGFRDEEFNLEKKDNITRIAIIGDSFTFGWGINDTKNTYPKILEGYLNNEDKEYEVMNFGLPGTNVLDNFWILKYSVVQYEPEVVLYGFVVNDVEFLEENLDLRYCSALDGRTPGFLYYLDKKYDNMRINMRKSGTDINLYSSMLYEDRFYGYSCLSRILEKAQTLSKKENFKFIIYFIPVETYTNEHDIYVDKKLQELTHEKGIKYLSNFTSDVWKNMSLMKENDLRIDLEEKEYHLNELGNRIIAEKIYEEIQK